MNVRKLTVMIFWAMLLITGLAACGGGGSGSSSSPPPPPPVADEPSDSDGDDVADEEQVGDRCERLLVRERKVPREIGRDETEGLGRIQADARKLGQVRARALQRARRPATARGGTR